MDEPDTEKERAELEILTDGKAKFQIRGRVFYLPQPYLGTLDYLSREFVDMDFSEDAFQSASFDEAKRMVLINARRSAKVVAIAVLNSHWKIRFLTPFLSWYFRWNLKPADLLMLTNYIITAGDLRDFVTSIRFLSVSRTTKPQSRTTAHLVEKATVTDDGKAD